MSSESPDEECIARQAEEHDEDVFSILVATDIHLGFAEKDPVRANDTFDTFEEVLKTAKENRVDFLLLGGDLFHESRPSTYCIYKCIELLKRYCLGDEPVQVEFLSDPSHNFSNTGDDTVNYEDPNLNVELPVFSVHGNHDDPTGEHQISAMNLVASTGLVNYFGKCSDHSSVEIQPILLRKGQTKLALYGLSHIKDEKLARLIFDKKFSFAIPPEPDWFHLLVLHQNRANRGVKTFVPDDALPDILDLVIWGHEHDCRIEPERTNSKTHILQPGSTVATSLCIGEAIPKHVALLKVYKNNFHITPVPLKTVRPFVFREMILKKLDGQPDEEEVECTDQLLTRQTHAEKQVESEIEIMITEANQQGQLGNKLPLLRLIVAYVDESQTFNTIRFGQKYIGRVANPKDMVKLRSTVKKSPRHGKEKNEFLTPVNQSLPSRVEDLVMQYFEDNQQKQLKCLSLNFLNASVVKCIDANEYDAPVLVTKELINELRTKLEESSIDIDGVDGFVNNAKEQEADGASAILDRLQTRKRPNVNQEIDSDSDLDATNGVASSPGAPPTLPAKKPGARGGRGSRGARGRGRGKALS
ncbi:hypothetical protein YQE_10649, partial [Dendroctonus ponderosae]